MLYNGKWPENKRWQQTEYQNLHIDAAIAYLRDAWGHVPVGALPMWRAPLDVTGEPKKPVNQHLPQPSWQLFFN